MNKTFIKTSFYCFLISIFFLLSCGSKRESAIFPKKTSQEQLDTFQYIDNGVVRLGVDLSAGGCIFHFSESETNRNLLNHYDKGRFVQQSYYGIEDSSKWDGAPWRWNPIQGGGYKGEPAKILEQEIGKDYLHIISRPKHWATGEDINDATMEEKISLKTDIAHIQYTFRYTGTTIHPTLPQEVPAIFVDAELKHLRFYDGDSPWTNEELRSVIPGWPNESQHTSEHWAAYVDDSDWGIGIYTPGTEELTTYRFEGDGKTGPKGSACSYFAPILRFNVKPKLVFTYDLYITIGNIDQIRDRFNKIREQSL